MEKRWEQRNTESHKSVSLKVVKYYENKNKPYGKHLKKKCTKIWPIEVMRVKIRNYNAKFENKGINWEIKINEYSWKIANESSLLN